MNKKLLKINLSDKSFSFSTPIDCENYIGGQPLAYHLLKGRLNQEKVSENYVSISTGPLNGLFPYTSKSILTHLSPGLNLNMYVGGGSIGALMNMSNIIAIEIVGNSEAPTYMDISPKEVKFIGLTKDFVVNEYGLGGRRSRMKFHKTITCDEYFSFGAPKTPITNNLYGLTFSSTGELPVSDFDAYFEVVEMLKTKSAALSVTKSFHPSCTGCPMGCALSKAPETENISILPRALVSCAYAESVYTDIPTVFSCLSVLGYNYTHEFLELFSNNIGDMIKDTNTKLEEVKSQNSITGIV